MDLGRGGRWRACRTPTVCQTRSVSATGKADYDGDSAKSGSLSLPATFYVEGISTGSAHVHWKLLNPDDVTVFEDVVKFDVLALDLYSIDYDATDSDRFHVITQDPTAANPSGVAYGVVEWLDANCDGDVNDTGDHDYPVCYTRSGPQGDVKVKVDEVKIRAYGNLGTNLKVKATGICDSGEIHLVQADANMVGDYIVATLQSQEAIPGRIACSTITLLWYVSLDGGAHWTFLDTSMNDAYLTWDDPTLSPLYETCLYIGCEAADGMGGTNSAAVLDAVWTSSFSTRHVERLDGELLTYYGYRDNNHNGVYDAGVDDSFNSPDLCDVTDTAGLLSEQNGQCLSWADLMTSVLLAQGIDSIGGESLAIVSVVIKADPPPHNLVYAAFAVKNWDGARIRRFQAVMVAGFVQASARW